jgi:type VI secretion system secreted protein VgrG
MAEQPRSTGDEADFTFRAGELTTDDLRVTAFRGMEGISELFWFTVELCSRRADIDFETVVGKPCVLEIIHSAGSRYVNGIVRRFERTGEVRRAEGTSEAMTHYRAEVAPYHWLLTKRYKSRIFQQHNCDDMTVPGIIKKVLEDAGIPGEKFRFALEYTEYAEREFVVQYRETDFAFISRLMEHEGIFYFFEHTADGHVMVVGDSGVAHADTPDAAEFAFREPTGLIEEQEYIDTAAATLDINYGAICLDDYNFKRPATELRATVQADQYTSLEYSDYPGEYVDGPVGKRYAQMRLEEYQCTRNPVDLQGTVRALLAGFKFSLIEHPAESMNREYLLTRISHLATQPQSGEEQSDASHGAGHRAQIRAIAADVPFRPARSTRKPVVIGSQTALVTGPSGEEVYTDDDGYGRVKCQFHWDLEGEHNENSSCWIRVSQGMAGGNYGMMFLPRVGQEVIVDFLEGNPDQPMITGRVYNNDNMPPYSLPDEKTKSTIKSRSSIGGEGFNELRFEDKKGSEQIFMHAQKNHDRRVKADERVYVGNDRHVIVHRDQKHMMERDEHRIVKRDQFETVYRDRSLTVGCANAESVDGAHSLRVGGDVAEAFEQNHCMEVSQTCTIKAMEVVIDASVGVTLKCGGSFVKVDASGVAINGPMILIKSGGAAGSPNVIGATATAQPEEPDPAATGDPGQDYTYEQERREYAPLDDSPWHEDDDEDPEKHWIGIRLFDDNGQPLAGEKYEVILPDGTTVARGRTNSAGEAEVRGLDDPGSCEVTFPDLDTDTWAAGPPPGGAGSGEGAASSTAGPSSTSGASAPSQPTI